MGTCFSLHFPHRLAFVFFGLRTLKAIYYICIHAHTHTCYRFLMCAIQDIVFLILYSHRWFTQKNLPYSLHPEISTGTRHLYTIILLCLFSSTQAHRHIFIISMCVCVRGGYDQYIERKIMFFTRHICPVSDIKTHTNTLR